MTTTDFPTMPVVQGSDDGGVTFTIGDGPSTVLVGTYEDGANLMLVIGGSSICDRDDLTLTDLEQLRDNLSAIIADARLRALLGVAPLVPPVTAMPPVLWAPGKNANLEPIGEIDGFAVFGETGFDAEDPTWRRQFVHLDWGGWHLVTDGRTFLNLPDAESGLGGDIGLTRWEALRVLFATGIADRLMAMARQWCDVPQQANPK